VEKAACSPAFMMQNHSRHIDRQKPGPAAAGPSGGQDTATAPSRLGIPVFDDTDVIKFMRWSFRSIAAYSIHFPIGSSASDFFRYLAVLRFGGFLFRSRCFPFAELTELLAQRCVFPFEELTLKPFICATPAAWTGKSATTLRPAAGDPFMAAVVENCVRASTIGRGHRCSRTVFPAPFRSRFEVLTPRVPVSSLAPRRAKGVAAGVKILYPDEVCDSRQCTASAKLWRASDEASWP